MKKAKGKPDQSRSREREGSGMTSCKGRYFTPIEDPSVAEFSDYQEIKLQELFKTL